MTEPASVRVAVRVRPMSEREKAKDTLPVVTASTEKAEVTLIRGSSNRQQRQTYSFDQVHSSFSSQRDVFETTRPLVVDVLAGYEATVCSWPDC
jgi:kinesin family protein 11